MTFYTSSLTLEAIQLAVSDAIDKTVSDYKVVKAVNNALNRYRRLEMRYEPQRYTKYTDAISLDPNGYALSNITDLMSDSEGFVVYRDQIQNGNILPSANQNRVVNGYEIRSDGKIYPNPTTNSYTIYIKYLAKPTQFSLTSIDMSQVIPIEMFMEEAFENYIIDRYFRSKGQPALAQDAEAKFNEDFVSFYNQRATRVHVL